MHELPIVKKITEYVLHYAEQEEATRVRGVWLEIGSLHDLIDEWVIKYFAFATKNTIAEGADLHITRTPVICKCKACGEYFTVDIKQYDAVGACPVCQSADYDFTCGNELMIQRIEIEKDENPASDPADPDALTIKNVPKDKER